jgi:serine protease Do
MLLAPQGSAQPAAASSPGRLAELSGQFESLAALTTPSVVQIVVSGLGQVAGPEGEPPLVGEQNSGGSGVIVDANGYILTNSHVIEGAQRIQVHLTSVPPSSARHRSILRPKTNPREARVIGVDSETDLAVLKIDETELPALEFGDSETLRQGQIVFAFGSPLGLENSVTMGVVSSVARQLEPDSPMIYIQTDTAINPGSSGGPLVDVNGKVVGISTLIFSQSGGNEGIGFAAPSNIVEAVYKQIRANGAVRRGEIGVGAQTITPLLAAGLKLDRDWGVVIADVEPGGPASIRGVEVGDVIVSMNGKTMENARQFDVNLYQMGIGDVATLDILRGAKEQTIRVAVLERTDDPDRFARMVNREANEIERLGVLGLEITPEIERMLPPLRGSAGVIVAARVADGPQINRRFQVGDVIYSVNGVVASGLAELRRQIGELKPGEPAAIFLERMGKTRFVALEMP